MHAAHLELCCKHTTQSNEGLYNTFTYRIEFVAATFEKSSFETTSVGGADSMSSSSGFRDRDIKTIVGAPNVEHPIAR